MSQLFRIWHASPLPFDTDSATDDWRQRRALGEHDPRLDRCLARLRQELSGHDPSMLWAEEPEADPPCAVLTLAPATGSLDLTVEAILAAAAAEGLCVLNDFDGSVTLPDGRRLVRLSLALDPPLAAPPAPEADAAPQSDAQLAKFLHRQWTPLFRESAFQIRPLPANGERWYRFVGAVLRVDVLCSVLHSTLQVSVHVTPGGHTLPPELQTESGCGHLYVELIALAQDGGLRVGPELRHNGVLREYVTHFGHEGDAHRLAQQWGALFRHLLQWLQPLDDIQALASMVDPPSTLWEPIAEHPAEGFMFFSEVKVVAALLAKRSDAQQRAFRRLAVMEGQSLQTHRLLRSVLPALQVPLGLVRSGARRLVVWQGVHGSNDHSDDPLAELERLKSSASDAGAPPTLQCFLAAARARFSAKAGGNASGYRVTPLPDEAPRPWLDLQFATNADGTLQGSGTADRQIDLALRPLAYALGLTVYSVEDCCVWTPDGRLHHPHGSTSLVEIDAPTPVAGRPLSSLQAFVQVRQALASAFAAHGFRLGLNQDLFVKANAVGYWAVWLRTPGVEGLLLMFTPYVQRDQGAQCRSLTLSQAVETIYRERGQAAPDAPRSVQLAMQSPENLDRAIARMHTLLEMGVFDLLDALDEPARCRSWLEAAVL
jgi:hypothetical protein